MVPSSCHVSSHPLHLVPETARLGSSCAEMSSQEYRRPRSCNHRYQLARSEPRAHRDCLHGCGDPRVGFAYWEPTVYATMRLGSSRYASQMESPARAYSSYRPWQRGICVGQQGELELLRLQYTERIRVERIRTRSCHPGA